ncbi:MAG: hypothetical protein CME64_17600 [Halobacteriovoraceae bacterium]|nr:hypothetical protein [Halobacteriovoraceae bacterium]|tara:strand:+ start:20761 stop:22200 length:1440 start_codon:yes stop_codon:yes gene_type:complete
MRKLKTNILLNQIGSSMITVMIGGVAIGLGAMMVAKTGLERGKMYADTSQNTLIEYAMLDLKTNLASQKVCKDSMDSGFTQIGPYSVGDDLGGGVSIEQIRDQNPGMQDRDILIVFKKDKAQGSASRRTDKISIQTFKAPDPADPTGVATIESCSSFQIATAEEGLENFCKAIGGVYDSAEGRCDPNLATDSKFRDDVDALACEVLGGTLNGSGECDLISISGNLMSKTFKPALIKLGGGSRNNAVGGTCSNTQVGRGLSSDGKLNCETIKCPQPSDSTYSPRYVGSQLYCECQRDRGAKLGCGEEDVNSCEDYEVDDGCGNGGTCVIRRKKKVCPEIPSCVDDGPKNYYSTEGCNYYCGQAPKCAEGEEPEVPEEPKCEDTSWTPNLATVCDTDRVTQTSNCGNTRRRPGTKDCSAKGCWELGRASSTRPEINPAGFPKSNWTCTSGAGKPPKNCKIGNRCVNEWKYGTREFECLPCN